MGSAITIETLELIEQYLKGELNATETIAFEKAVATDALLREEVQIQEQLFAMHHVATKNKIPQEADAATIKQLKEKLRSNDLQALSNKIRKAGQEQVTTKSSTKSKNSYLLYAVAASIAIVIASTLYFVNATASLDTYYKENINWEDLPSFAVKGQAEDAFTQGETYFKKKAYKDAITAFKTIETTNELYPYSLLYIGASYEQLNANQKALETFDSLSKLTSFEEHSKGYWYQLLVYLKLEDREKALEMKTIILKDKTNYNYSKVLELKI